MHPTLPNAARRTALGITGALMLLYSGCREVNGVPRNGPLSGPLNGTWLGPIGVDTYDEFQIEERDTAVVGLYVLGGALGTPTKIPLSGVAHLPQVVLRWGDGQASQFLANVTLAPDSQSFSGTMSLNGNTPRPFGPYRRLPPP